MRPIHSAVLAGTALALLVGCGGGTKPATQPSTSTSAKPSTSTSPSSSTASSPAPAETGDRSSKTAAQIQKEAQSALADVTSVRVRGGGLDEGERVEFDLAFKNGVGAAGTATDNGKKLDLIRIGDDVYLRGTAAAWSGTLKPAQVRRLGNKYVKVALSSPDSQQFLAYLFFTDLEGLAGNLEAEGKVTKGERRTINGTDAIGLVDPSDKSVLYIAVSGPAYPVRLIPDPKGTDEGQIDFLDYGKPVQVAAPPAAQVVALSALGS